MGNIMERTNLIQEITDRLKKLDIRKLKCVIALLKGMMGETEDFA